MIDETADYGEREARLIHYYADHPVITPPGYMITDTRPGGVNYWRRLWNGNPPRPLAQLAAFEAAL